MNKLRDRLGESSYLLTPDAVLLPDGPQSRWAVVVIDGLFAAVGPVEEVAPRYPHLPRVTAEGHVLLPGFVDAHHHLTQAFGTSLAFGEPSEIFRRVWVPLEAALNEESAYVAAKLACLEALRGGFTTVADAGTRAPIDADAVASAAEDAGVRCVIGRICNDSSPDDPGGQEVLARAERHLSRYRGRPLTHPSLAISMPEAATPDTLRAIADLAHAGDAPLQIHLNEHLGAVERSLVQHGLRPIEYLDSIGVLGPWILGAHATLLTPHEMLLLRDSEAAISYNPVASAWKGNAVAPALMLHEMGVRLGLGTDGTRGDGFRLLDAAESAQRLSHGLRIGDSSCGGGWLWLETATRGGADAVGLASVTGEIAQGRAADFLLVDTRVPEMTPSWDLVWELSRLGNRDQITAVVVAGRIRLWQGWPTQWDGRALIEQAATMGRKVAENAPITRVHSTSAQHRKNRDRTT